MLVLSFLLLMLVFRSVLVPLKAVLMNLLSIGAAYGVIVAAFRGAGAATSLGVSAGPIEAWVPMMLFAIVFGLSMDYEVFLISAIREHYDRTGDNGQAVADGLESTARVITAATLIMVFVFGSLRRLGRAGAEADRSRARGCGGHRRHHRPDRARARDDGAARQGELVVAALAPSASFRPCTSSRCRSHPRSRPHARRSWSAPTADGRRRHPDRRIVA